MGKEDILRHDYMKGFLLKVTKSVLRMPLNLWSQVSLLSSRSKRCFDLYQFLKIFFNYNCFLTYLNTGNEQLVQQNFSNPINKI